MSTESVMPSNCLVLCCPLLLLPSIFPRIKVFCSESVLCIRWTKYWSFSFSISSSSEYSGLVSLRTGWCDLLAVQGVLKRLLQYHTSKASVLQHSATFMVQHHHFIFLYFCFFFFFAFYWSGVNLRCCVSFKCMAIDSVMHIYSVIYM